MGAYNSTYIGIYLEVPFSKTTKIDKYYVHSETGKKQNSKFDANTGRENILKEESKEVDVYPSPYIENVEGLNEDEFWTPAYTGGCKRTETFILNGNRKYSNVDDDLFNFDLSGIDISKLIDEFKIEYKPYLDYYMKEYGEFEVKYGVVNYAN